MLLLGYFTVSKTKRSLCRVWLSELFSLEMAMKTSCGGAGLTDEGRVFRLERPQQGKTDRRAILQRVAGMVSP